MNNKKQIIVYFSLILAISLTRILPHPPNFTPIISLAIIGPFLFTSVYLSIICILISMMISDYFIGFHDGIFQIYTILALISILFNKYKNKFTVKNIFYYSLAGSLLFFVLSNLNVWLFGSLYTKDIYGLISCYIMAIPFFGNTLLSTIIFTYLIFFISNRISKFSLIKN